MNRLLCFFLVSSTLVWCSIGPDCAYAISIFDNTENPSTAVFGPTCCQVGNEIVLGGRARDVIEVTWLVDSQNTDVLLSGIETHIYANDGAGGAPGTLLWSSGLLAGIPVSATDTFLAIAVPNIVVPDRVTVTSRMLDAAPVGLGRLYVGPPTVGSLTTSWIETTPGEWHQQFGPRGLRVTAVPEPSTVLLFASGGVIFLWLTSGGTKIRRHASFPAAESRSCLPRQRTTSRASRSLKRRCPSRRHRTLGQPAHVPRVPTNVKLGIRWTQTPGNDRARPMVAMTYGGGWRNSHRAASVGVSIGQRAR